MEKAKRQARETEENERGKGERRRESLVEEKEKVVVDIISGLQTVSHHLMGQTSLLSPSPLFTLSLTLPVPSLRSAKISSSKQDLIMPIDKMSKYSSSPLKKKEKTP